MASGGGVIEGGSLGGPPLPYPFDSMSLESSVWVWIAEPSFKFLVLSVYVNDHGEAVTLT